MPSPIAHLTAAYVIYRLARRFAAVDHELAVAQKEAIPTRATVVPRNLLLTCAAFSMLPDLDSVAGLLAGNFGRYHNNVTHSLLVGAAISLGFASLMPRRRRTFWYFVALTGYCLHVLMDGATSGRGVMALWPISSKRYSLPLALFYGFHWSDGLHSVRHLWTVATELLFTGAVLLWSIMWSARSRRTR